MLVFTNYNSINSTAEEVLQQSTTCSRVPGLRLVMAVKSWGWLSEIAEPRQAGWEGSIPGQEEGEQDSESHDWGSDTRDSDTRVWHWDSDTRVWLLWIEPQATFCGFPGLTGCTVAACSSETLGKSLNPLCLEVIFITLISLIWSKQICP